MNVGELSIALRADVARLQADMNEAKQAVSGAMKDIEQYVGYAKTAFLSLGGVLSVNAFKDAIGGAIEFKARLLDLSAQTGIGVEALGALGKTGKLTSTSLDDITAASAKLSKAVQTQNEDSKGAAQAIAALGLNFNTFKALRPEEQMLAVAKAMAGFADGAGKTADAMLLFGKSGATLLPFLRDLGDRTDLNSKQTEEASRQAKEYENNLKKITAAGGMWKDQLANAMLPALVAFTNQMLEAKTAGEKLAVVLGNVAGKFDIGNNTALDDQRRRLEGANGLLTAAGRELGFYSALGPLFAGQADMARQKVEAYQKVIGELSASLKAGADAVKPPGDPDYGNEGRGKPKPQITLPAGVAAAAGGSQKDLYADLIKVVNERLAQQELEASMGRKLTDIESLQAKAYADINAGLINATLKQKLYLDGLFDLAKTEQALARERERSQKENDKTLETADRRLGTLRTEADTAKLLLDQYGKSSEQLQQLAIARDRETAAILRQRTAGMDDVGAMGQLRDVYLAQADALTLLAQRKDAIAAKEARDRNDPQAGALSAVKSYLSDIQRAGDSTRAAVENSLKSLEDSTVAVLRGGNAKDAAKQWVSGIITEIYRLAVVRPLLNSIFGGNSSGGSSLSGLMGLVGSVAGFFSGGESTNYTGGQLPTAGGRAAGGPVSAGQSYLVGEQGPEILRMGNQAGNIVPNGFGAVTLNVINRGEPVKGAVSQRQTDQGMVVDLIIDTVAADVTSGGKVGSALAATYQLNRAGGASRY